MKMTLETKIKIVTTLVAVSGLVFGVVKFFRVQEIEASKPFLEKKLEWCIEAVETASSIANSPDDSVKEQKRFWELYWGVMGLIEEKDVEKAMIIFGESIETKDQMKNKSLAIAHACRRELARSWSTQWGR